MTEVEQLLKAEISYLTVKLAVDAIRVANLGYKR
jgi:hypothetical protein